MQVEPFYLRSWTTFLFVRFTVASLVEEYSPEANSKRYFRQF
jgi:hypothetical protein